MYGPPHRCNKDQRKRRPAPLVCNNNSYHWLFELNTLNKRAPEFMIKDINFKNERNHPPAASRPSSG